MTGSVSSAPLLDFLVDRLEVGILVVDSEMKVTLWNHFMATHSGLAAHEVVGHNLFDCFPDLPAKWLEKKIRSVFLLKNYAFTSWEQRPYLFRFNHNRPITGGVEAMQQNCTLLPICSAEGEVVQVCISVFDVTDVALYQKKLVHAIAQLDEEKAAQETLIIKLHQAQDALQELANCDGLTKLANRRQFDKVLKSEWSRAVREATPLSLLMIDVDHFKLYNDTYGHQGGDACLQFVAGAMADEQRLRASDLVARYGGEEFAVILPCTPIEGALVVAERMRVSVDGLGMQHCRSSVADHVTISIGAACMVPSRLSDPERLLAVADAALYRAKHEGRNRVVMDVPAMAETGQMLR
jgi:diguanylate cyclase